MNEWLPFVWSHSGSKLLQWNPGPSVLPFPFRCGRRESGTRRTVRMRKGSPRIRHGRRERNAQRQGADKEPDAGEPHRDHAEASRSSPPRSPRASSPTRSKVPRPPPLRAHSAPQPALARRSRPRGGAGNTRRLRRSRGGRSAGRRCRFPIAPSQRRGRGARAPARARGSGDKEAPPPPPPRLRPGPAPATCRPPSRAPPSSRGSRRRRGCRPRGRGGEGSGAGVGTEAPPRGGENGRRSRRHPPRRGGRRPCCCPGAPMAREQGECELHCPPAAAAASPRAARPAPPGAARVAAAPQLRAPGRWLR